MQLPNTPIRAGRPAHKRTTEELDAVEAVAAGLSELPRQDWWHAFHYRQCLCALCEHRPGAALRLMARHLNGLRNSGVTGNALEFDISTLSALLLLPPPGDLSDVEELDLFIEDVEESLARRRSGLPTGLLPILSRSRRPRRKPLPVLEIR